MIAHLVPAVLAAPLIDVCVIGSGAAGAGRAATGAVASAVGAEGAVQVFSLHSNSASLAVGDERNEGDDEEDKGHFRQVDTVKLLTKRGTTTSPRTAVAVGTSPLYSQIVELLCSTKGECWLVTLKLNYLAVNISMSARGIICYALRCIIIYGAELSLLLLCSCVCLSMSIMG